MNEILVIGAGVCGLTSAVQIAEFYGDRANVTLIAEKYSPDTTGDGSAGLWSPYLCKTDKNVLAWSEQTHKFFMALWRQGLANEVGLSLLPMMRLTSESKYEDADWISIPYGGHRLSDKQLESLGRDYKKKFTGGIHFVSFTCDVTKLLPYLLERFKNAGGVSKQGKVTDIVELERLGQFDVVVNCTGLGAKELIADETDLHPIRGQVNRVKAPWMYQVILDDDDDGNYIIPNTESVILGGTHQYHNRNIEHSQQDDQFITEGCQQLVPGLKHAALVKQWVGLRPGRSSIRLEVQRGGNGPKGRSSVVIHNYGHGGSGVTLCWGCATAVLKRVREVLGDKLDNKL